jgi:enoyl-CoA hydratase
MIENRKGGGVTYSLIEVDEPMPRVRRISLNRPEKRNALNHTLRGDIIRALQEHDKDPDVRVTILRGNGKSFSAGYDLAGGNEGLDLPYFTAAGEGAWPRHVTDGWMGIWDLAKPVIAQVHGYCLAGGSELATCCDLVFIAEDAQMGYPAVRFGVPDMHFHSWFLGMRTAMKMMLTGDSISRIAKLPSDVLQLNKRIVHRGMETMGLRTAIRLGTEICALGIHTETMERFIAEVQGKGLTAALSERDGQFGDYRTAAEQPSAPTA